MAYQHIKLEREKLYEQVWSKPMIHLAKDYGLSDNGLRKICRRFNIPVPDSGYWQKIQYGKPVKQAPLPEFQGDSGILISRIDKRIPQVEPELYKDVQAKIAQELLPENKIIVPNILTKPHPLVIQAKKNIIESYKYKNCVSSGRESLDIRVSRTNLNRALCIMDILIKELEARGMRVFINTKDQKELTCVEVLGKVFEIALQETLKYIKIKNGYFDHDYQPTGQLVLRIKRDYEDYRTRWVDVKNQKVEDRLNSFIIGLYEAALWERASEIEREKWHRELKEKERKEEEARRLKEEELKRMKGLENDTLNWHKSRNIRSYIKASEKAYLQKNRSIIPGAEFDKWRIWASHQADRLDPLLAGSSFGHVISSRMAGESDSIGGDNERNGEDC